MEFRRTDISREELYTSDELFLTGTAAGVTPVREVDGRKIGNEKWPIIQQLRKTYDDIVHGKNQKYAKWLTLVKSERRGTR
jgi:branched-chain amino acid aminotransferase